MRYKIRHMNFCLGVTICFIRQWNNNKLMNKNSSQKVVRSKPKRSQRPLVVVSRVAARPRQPRASVPRSLANNNNNSLLRSYELALLDPFNPDAIGARVPDMWSAPTATYHSHCVASLSSNASGVCSFVYFPGNPLVTIVDMTGSSVGSSQMSQIGTSNIYSLSGLTPLTSALSSCRVVGAGCRIRNLLVPTAATGRVIMASVPVVGDAPGWNAMNANLVTNTRAITSMTGLPIQADGYTTTTAGVPADIIDFPDAVELTVQELITDAAQGKFKPFTPSAFDFHNTLTYYNLSATVGAGTSVAETIATGAVLYVDNEDTTNYRGGNAILVRMSGLPASSTVCDLELIVHLEGAPAVATVSGAVLPAAPSPPFIDIAGHQRVLSKCLGQKVFSIVEKAVGGNYIGAGLEGASLLAGKRKTRQMNLMMAKLGITL